MSLVAGALISCSAMAENTLTVDERAVSGTGENMGEITVSETPYGLLFHSSLNGLTPRNSRLPCHTQTQAVCRNEEDGKEVPALITGGHHRL